MRNVIGLAALFVCATTNVVSAEPATGVTPILLSRGTYESFNVKSKTHDPITGERLGFDFDFHAKANTDIDVVVREHVYAPGGDTGWHTHPGPLFITVKSGALTIYEYDDPCTPITVLAGEGYVDTGRGHIAYNASSVEPATDVTVITAPVGLPFRKDIDPPPDASECPES